MAATSLQKQLEEAAKQQIISAEQAAALGQFLKPSETAPRFTFEHILYYLGGLLAIGAMTLFLSFSWERFGGLGILLVSAIYAIIGGLLAHRLREQQRHIPAAICIVFVVCLMPVMTYGVLHWLGWWSVETQYSLASRPHWITLELVTIIAGLIALWRYQYPFIMLPLALALWQFSMDGALFLLDDRSWVLREQTSMVFGLILIVVALWADIRTHHRGDYAFWLYMVGVLTFWGGMSLLDSGNEWRRLIYFIINLVLIGVGAMLVRRVFIIVGAIGSTLYLSHLANDLFSDSWLFPVSLAAIGLLILWSGVLWQRHHAVITEKTRLLLPLALRQLLDAKN